MADTEAHVQAAKTRIVSHMNKDHHDSIIRYLEHFAKLSSSAAYDGKMTDIDLNGLSLVCSGKSYQIPFQPPLKSYTEARERVVEVDKQCRKALGQSDVTVKTYVPPTGFDAVVCFAVVATLVGYSQRGWFAPGGPVEQSLGKAFAQFSWKIQPALFYGILVAHAAETAIFTSKLKQHSVNSRTSVYWLWLTSLFIEGYFASSRFGRFVKAQREQSKH